MVKLMLRFFVCSQSTIKTTISKAMQLPVLRWSYFSANTGLNCFPKVNNFENPQTQTINNGVNLFKKLNEEFGDFMKKDPTSMP